MTKSKQIKNSSLTKQVGKAKNYEPLTNIKYIWGIIISIIAFLLYANTIGHDYALDDSGAITGNRYVQEGFHGIFKLLKVDFWHFANAHLGYYRPLSLITFAIEYHFVHGNPHVSHFINCLIFALSGGVLFILLNKILKSYHPVFSFAIALLFVAHPIHTEIVANVKGRDELLSFFNVMLMLWFALKYIDSKKIWYLIISLVFCYLGMLSKETALTGVMLVPVFLFYYTDEKVIDCLKKSIPYAIVLALFFIQKKYLLGTLSGVIPGDIVNYPYTNSHVKLPTTFMLFAFCLRLLFVPQPLRYDYSFNQLPAIDFSNGLAWLGIVLFFAGAYFAYKQTFKKSIFGFALSIFYITLIPSLAFTILRGGIFAERFLFFPSLGFSIALVYVACLLVKIDISASISSIKIWLRSNTKYILLISVLFILYSFKTVTRNAAWKDNFTLFSTDIKTGKNSAQNQYHYANQYIYFASIEKDEAKKQDYVSKAIAALRQSLRIHPRFGESYYLLGLAYQLIIPNTDSAIYYYNRAIATAPGYSDSYYHLGILYQILGKNNVASYYYNEAIKYNPQYLEPQKAAADLKAIGIDVYLNPLTSFVDSTSSTNDTRYYYELGNHYASLGDYTKAAESFVKSIELGTNNDDASINLANCYGMLKQYDKALAVDNELLSKNPKNKFALKNIAVVYNLLGDAKKSNEYLQKVKEIEGN